MPTSETSRAQQRIIDASAELFSTVGYNATTTRHIAQLAEVTETTIFRHYANKRGLFEATLDAEFSKVRLRADLISKLAGASDARTAMRALLEVMTDAVLQQRALVRMVYFGVLEFDGDLNELYRRHVRGSLQTASAYLARWPELSELSRFDGRITIVAFIATLIALQDFYPALSGEKLSHEQLQQAASTCAELWHTALVGSSAPDHSLPREERQALSKVAAD